MNLAEQIDRLTWIITIVAIVIFLVIGLGIAYYWYYSRVLRKKRQTEEEVDYSTFDRKDAKEYAKYIDDIQDDMIITENATRFIGVISCRGFDFYSAHVAERYNAQSGFRAFINTLNNPITYRQYTRRVDMGHTLNNYMESLTKVTEKVFDMTQNYNDMKRNLNQMEKKLGSEKALEDPDYITLVDATEEARKQIENMEWRRFHLEDQIAYIKQLSEDYAPPSPSETYVFDWYYNPMDFPIDLSEEEVLERAKIELAKIASAKIHALAGAGVKARRCTTNELIDMCRLHLNPISGERFSMEDVENSTFFEDITGTDMENELKEQFLKENTEDLEIQMSRALEKMNIQFSNMPPTDVRDLSFERKDDLAEEEQQFRLDEEKRQMKEEVGLREDKKKAGPKDKSDKSFGRFKGQKRKKDQGQDKK